MGMYRLYTGTDREAHIEEFKLADHPELSSLRATVGIMFREMPPGHYLDWHPAPRRQWVIILAGQLEIGLGDGTLRRFQAGDARLVEDITGRGHTTRVVGNQPCLTAVVPLAEAE